MIIKTVLLGMAGLVSFAAFGEGAPAPSREPAPYETLQSAKPDAQAKPVAKPDVSAVTDEKAAMETRPADAQQFKNTAENRLKEWDARIEGMKKEDASQAKTAVRDLESHRDRIRDELARVSERDTLGNNETAQSTIDRHFKQMDQVYTSNRAQQDQEGRTVVQ